MKLNLDIAEFTRNLQSQNGLRHADYHRYRRFCTRKLHRLRTSLKIPNGRHRFKKAIFPETIVSARFLQILILQAERAWAHAITLKSEFSMGEAKGLGRIRHRYIRKFYRAARASRDALALAERFCDDQTVKEAKAYHSWLSALALTEGGQYESALKILAECTAEYNGLIKNSLDVVLPGASKAYRHRITDLEPVERVCKYKLRLSQPLQAQRAEEASPRSGGDDFESVYEMSDEGEGEIEFGSSDSELEDEDDVRVFSPRNAKSVEQQKEGILGKIGGWWSNK